MERMDGRGGKERGVDDGEGERGRMERVNGEGGWR